MHRWHNDNRSHGTLAVAIPLVIVALIPFAVAGVTRYFKYIRIEQNLTGKLKQAADSNGIPLAQEKLGESIKWMEANGYTEGSSHVWIKTPPCDIGFFYKNLVSAKEDLDKFPPPPSETDAEAQSSYDLAESNQLMKLRETLVDEGGESGPAVTCPPNMAEYPSQMLWFWIWPTCLAWAVVVAIFGFRTWEWH